jgi:K+-transporting ATPase ATPase B chain
MNMPAKNAAPVKTQEPAKTAISALWRPALVQASSSWTRASCNVRR